MKVYKPEAEWIRVRLNNIIDTIQKTEKQLVQLNKEKDVLTKARAVLLKETV